MKQRFREIMYRARNVTSAVRLPPAAPLGHYYSPLTSPADAARAIGWAQATELPSGLKLDLAAMDSLARILAPMWADVDTSGRYSRNLMFNLADAAIYHSLLRHFCPSLIIEVGSGFSTAVALDTIEKHELPTRIKCIEPNAERLHNLLRNTDNIELDHRFVQDVPLDRFKQLRSGDFLFLDSTHVVKAGSDVVWTTLHVLPLLAPGVLVHIHDIFWPMEYPARWLELRRDWNEIYLIHAFLIDNPSWRILFFNDRVIQSHPDLAHRYFPHMPEYRAGGLWLEKIR